MTLLLDLTFLIFGVVARASASYWKLFLAALVCQLLAQFLPISLASSYGVWILEYFVPLLLLFNGMKQDLTLTTSARGLFMGVWIASLTLGLWGQFLATKELRQRPNPLPTIKSEMKIYQPTIKNSEEEWQLLVSEQGCFRVMSPLPAGTQVKYKKIQGQELKVTTTNIKDIDECTRYMVLTTHYSEKFPRPPLYEQAKLALDHFLQANQLDELIEAQAIEQNKQHALAFHAKSSKSGEHLYGLIMPTESTLYQAMVFSCDEKALDDKAERFLTSFEPVSQNLAQAISSSKAATGPNKLQ